MTHIYQNDTGNELNPIKSSKLIFLKKKDDTGFLKNIFLYYKEIFFVIIFFYFFNKLARFMLLYKC
jgi:hypothetical protein